MLEDWSTDSNSKPQRHRAAGLTGPDVQVRRSRLAVPAAEVRRKGLIPWVIHRPCNMVMLLGLARRGATIETDLSFTAEVCLDVAEADGNVGPRPGAARRAPGVLVRQRGDYDLRELSRDRVGDSIHRPQEWAGWRAALLVATIYRCHLEANATQIEPSIYIVASLTSAMTASSSFDLQ